MNIFSTYYKQIAEIPIMECKRRRIEEIITHGERDIAISVMCVL